VTVRLYDSCTQSLRELEPLEPGKIGMYVCGPTVQSSPHIGHLRSALAYDLWRRWLSTRGYAVTFVRNVTDIDDKILATASGVSTSPTTESSTTEEWWALAYRVELEFTAAYSTIGILAPTYEPRATASVPQMQELISQLIERGHAYAVDVEADAIVTSGDIRHLGGAVYLAHRWIRRRLVDPGPVFRTRRGVEHVASANGGVGLDGSILPLASALGHLGHHGWQVPERFH